MHRNTPQQYQHAKDVPVKRVLWLGLEEVHQKEKLVGCRVHQVLQHRAQQHFERKALVFSLGDVHQNGLPLNLNIRKERGGKQKKSEQVSELLSIFADSNHVLVNENQTKWEECAYLFQNLITVSECKGIISLCRVHLYRIQDRKKEK